MLKPAPTAFKVDPDLEFIHPEISDMYEYWHGLKQNSPVPCRRDVDPVSAPRPLLPHMALAEIYRDGKDASQCRRYRWRLVGTHITTALGRDLTGGIIDEIYAEADKRLVSDTLDWVIERQQPMRTVGTAEFAGKEWLDFESVYLPLCQPCGTVNTVLLGTIFV